MSLVDGQPLATSRSVFPALRFPGFLDRLREEPSVTAAFLAEGIADYTRSHTRIDAKLASPMLALRLQIAQGAPVLRTTGINIDAQNAPIEYGVTWFAGDRVTLTLAGQELA